MTKHCREWLAILEAIAGVAGIGILWWQTNGFIALAVFLLIFSQNIYKILNK